MNNDFIESILIKMLYENDLVRERVLPHLSPKLVSNHTNFEIIKHFLEFYSKYSKFPTFSDTMLNFKNVGVLQDHFEKIKNIEISEYNNEFLLSQLETFFKEKLISDLCFETVEKLQGFGIEKITDIPDRLSNALGLSFDSKVAVDIFANPDFMWDYYHTKRNFIPTNINQLNECLGGGLFSETLTLFLAESNMGKTMIMTSLAASNLVNDKIVLFVTCEMTREEISSRIITNCFKMTRREIENLNKSKFSEMFKKVASTYQGKIYVEHFPAKTISPLDLKLYIKRFIQQHGKTPDIVYFDQLCSFNASNSNKLESSYIERENITLEFRAIGQIYKIPMVSVIQANRDGYKRSELDLTHTADSLGYVKHADFIIAVTQTEEYKLQNKFLWELLKSRNSIKNVKFTVLANFSFMNIEDDSNSKLRLRNKELMPDEKDQQKSDDVEELAAIVKKNKAKKRLDF